MYKVKTEDTEIFSELYDFMSDNLAKENLTTPLTKESFLFSVQNTPGEADMMLMETMDNPSFIQACYVGFLYRTQDVPAMETWEEHLSMPTEEFRQFVVSELKKAGEFKRLGSVVKHRMRRVVKEEEPEQVVEVREPNLTDKLYHVYEKTLRPVFHCLDKNE